MSLRNHPDRYVLTNEIHARPFPTMAAPGQALFLALKPTLDAGTVDVDAERKHLISLLDRFGASHPNPDATHYSGTVGRYQLKWECHTEFVSYLMFSDHRSARAFDPQEFEVFPDDWLTEAPGMRIASGHIRVEQRALDDEEIPALMTDWFQAESLASARILDDAAVVASDFRMDAGGHCRFAVFADPSTGPRRIGRIVQRLTEIEIYKTVSMLGLLKARALGGEIAAVEQRLVGLVGGLSEAPAAADAALAELLGISADLEAMTARTDFRFGATEAYEAIVLQRIKVLREERYRGLQTLSEFMTRRYDPAMRTVRSTKQRLQRMTERAGRAGQLLRTQVDVARSSQNQDLLVSMDRRADLQLRLQKTVEGLSVVAISYYAVSLAGYLIYPLAGPLGLSKGTLLALIAPVVILAVWLMARRIRHAIEK
ncbi:hypothetical protein ACMU_12940 [Actibacterium mucosum KCTC 23349]|uniref:Egg lysin n=1 Tax=Actibacterium mucosum KCTC 23349 TaxID=1454373 RepID=A0A037ZIY4_9RHOB|nr:DUF3422 domain-containing protein [Actibacterium mucosum]KAJ55594.1 hypothetical protein ACMU_12940 [Actibacterium mucosum KCTC 23349]